VIKKTLKSGMHMQNIIVVPYVRNDFVRKKNMAIFNDFYSLSDFIFRFF